MQWLRPAFRIVRADLPILPCRRGTALVTTVPVRWRCSADLSGPGRRGPPVLLNAR
jgi:hypothetical protein